MIELTVDNWSGSRFYLRRFPQCVGCDVPQKVAPKVIQGMDLDFDPDNAQTMCTRSDTYIPIFGIRITRVNLHVSVPVLDSEMVTINDVTGVTRLCPGLKALNSRK